MTRARCMGVFGSIHANASISGRHANAVSAAPNGAESGWLARWFSHTLERQSQRQLHPALAVGQGACDLSERGIGLDALGCVPSELGIHGAEDGMVEYVV